MQKYSPPQILRKNQHSGKKYLFCGFMSPWYLTKYLQFKHLSLKTQHGTRTRLPEDIDSRSIQSICIEWLLYIKSCVGRLCILV